MLGTYVTLAFGLIRDGISVRDWFLVSFNLFVQRYRTNFGRRYSMFNRCMSPITLIKKWYGLCSWIHYMVLFSRKSISVSSSIRLALTGTFGGGLDCN